MSKLAVVLICAGSVAGPSCFAAPQGAPGASEHAALVAKYCVGCHNERLKNASLSLQGSDISKPGDEADVWERVLRKVASHQMPPANLPHPDEAARKAFTTYLQTELDKAAALHPNPGRPTVHRLNRAEYSNSIRDLLALDIQPGSNLPPDDSGYGFDNIGDVLSISPVLIEKYISVGRNVARLAVGDTDVKPTIDTFTPVKETRSASRGGPKIPRNERISDDLPFDSSGGVAVRYTFPVDAEYLFRIKLPPAPGGDGAAPANYLEQRTPVKAGIRSVGVTFMRSSAVPEILPTLGNGRGGAAGGGRGGGGGNPQMAHLDLRLDGARLKLYDVADNGNGGTFTEFSIGGPYFSIGGPYNVAGAGETPSRKKVFVCRPPAGNDVAGKDEEGCARKILTTLARRAYRRPVTEADVKPLLAFYASGRKEKDFDNGIEMALRAMLVSPDFLFRVERDPATANASGIRRVNDYELASRLSFFLWSSIPDDELLGLADQNNLRDPKVVETQVARMLRDPKADAFLSNFAGQYLYLRNLAAQRPDPDVFPEFDNNLRQSFEKETQLFFNAIVRENRPVTDLLEAKFTYVNQHLAEFYGIPNVYGPQFRRVELTDANRAGILGQGSLLTVTSYPNRTSVVQRGKWVLENLLGTPPPPPPPNVPALEAHGKDGKLSMRQAMEAHRANPVCASCHSRMDPIGFALENFDGIGAWRDQDNGTLIDSSGKLPDGGAFNGAAGLKTLLLTQHRDEFISTFTAKLMTYALGRGLEGYDQPAVRAVMREAAKNNSTIPALIDAIVASPQFQTRKILEAKNANLRSKAE